MQRRWKRSTMWRAGLCLAAGFGITVALALVIAWRTFPLGASEAAAMLRRPEGLTAAPEFMIFNRTEELGARSWSVSLYSVPKFEPEHVVATVEEATRGMPGWVKRRMATHITTDPWPVHPLYPSGNVAIEPARVEVFGWPMSALWHGWRARQPYTVPSVWINDGAMRVGTRARWGQPRHLPTRVVWGGLVIDTVFWGGLVWVAVTGVMAARRRGRARRGLCVVCGYDLCGTPRPGVCPECGEGRKQ